MEFESYRIVRVRYNEQTGDYDELPTIFGADTREDADSIAARLNARGEGDSFTVESI